jgi:hypothetical protein
MLGRLGTLAEAAVPTLIEALRYLRDWDMRRVVHHALARIRPSATL